MHKQKSFLDVQLIFWKCHCKLNLVIQHNLDKSFQSETVNLSVMVLLRQITSIFRIFREFRWNTTSISPLFITLQLKNTKGFKMYSSNRLYYIL